MLHTVSSLHPETGGPARSVPGLAAAIAEKDQDVHLWSEHAPADYQPPCGITYCAGELESILPAENKWNLIHDHGLWLPVNHRIASLCRKATIPRVVSPRGMLEPWALQHRRWKKRLAWWGYQRRDLLSADCLHATSLSEAEQFGKLGLKNPVAILPNGVELPLLLDSLAHERGAAPVKQMLFLSRLHPKKGLPLLLEAWASVERADWKLIIAGPDEAGHRKELEAQAASLGIASSIDIRDAVWGDEKAALLRASHLFVLPSYSENFGIAVAEALAFSLPTITTTGCPWSELETDQCGWWVAPEKASLTKALSDAMELGTEERQAMGERARLLVERNYQWPMIGKKMSAVYEWLLGQSGRPDCLMGNR